MSRKTSWCRFCNNITLPHIIVALLFIVIVFEGISWTTDNINTQLNRELAVRQSEEAAKRSQAATYERLATINLATDIKTLLQAQGNLSQQNREGLVKAINTTYYEVFPDINEALQKIVNATPQSNFTAQKQGVANIEKILENQEIILQRLNTTK